MLRQSANRFLSATRYSLAPTRRFNPTFATAATMPSVQSVQNNGHSHALSKIEINVDCGEGYGQWKGGPDEEVSAFWATSLTSS